MAAMERRAPSSGGWIASLESFAKSNPATDADQARLTASCLTNIFAERREKELLGRKGAKALPRFFVRPPAPATTSPESVESRTSEEARVAAARAKLRAKARSRFLQRREDALMGFEDLADVEKALSTCVPPEPPRAPSTNATNDTTRPESSEDGPKKGLDDDRGVSATVLAEEALSSRQGQGQDGTPSSELSGGGNGSSDIDNDDDRLRNRDSSNPYTATEAQGGSADYMDFVRVRGMVSKKAAAFFTPGTFLRFPRDIRGRIPSQMFFKHVYESVSLQKTKLTLHFYDSEGLGFLREQDLENYVYDHIPTINALRGIHDNFYPFYVFTAVRRFMFFLDPKRTGKISIDALVQSRVMDELLELRMAGSADSSKKDSIASPAATTPAGGGEITQATSTVTRDDLTGDREHSKENDGSGGDGAREGQPMPDMSKNWFSAENTLRVYGEYLELDADQNGMLSKEELMNFGSRQRTRLTPVFVQRLFEEVVTYMTPSPSAPPSTSPPPRPPLSSPPPGKKEGESRGSQRHGRQEEAGGEGDEMFHSDSHRNSHGEALRVYTQSPPRSSTPSPPPLPSAATGGAVAMPAIAIADVNERSLQLSPSPPPPQFTSLSPPAPHHPSPRPRELPSTRAETPPNPAATPIATPIATPTALPTAALPSLFCPVPLKSMATARNVLPLPPAQGDNGISGGGPGAGIARSPSPTPSSPGGNSPAPSAVVAAASGLESSQSSLSPVGGKALLGSRARDEVGGEVGMRVRAEGEMDYKTFLDLMLAMENKQTRQAMQYFWRVLDAHGSGRLTISTINLFFRDVARSLSEGGFDTPDIADVKDEIFDMVKPEDPTCITLADLLRSGAGHTVVSMLVDTNGFWTYDNRESLHVLPEEDPNPPPAAAALSPMLQPQAVDSLTISSAGLPYPMPVRTATTTVDAGAAGTVSIVVAAATTPNPAEGVDFAPLSSPPPRSMVTDGGRPGFSSPSPSRLPVEIQTPSAVRPSPSSLLTSAGAGRSSSSEINANLSSASWSSAAASAAAAATTAAAAPSGDYMSIFADAAASAAGRTASNPGAVAASRAASISAAVAAVTAAAVPKHMPFGSS